MTTVQMNVNNKTSDSITANSAFDLKLNSFTPVMTAGASSIPSHDVIKSLNRVDNTSDGVYTGTGGAGFAVRGVVVCAIPGANATLVIYFDSTKCHIDTLSPGATITSELPPGMIYHTTPLRPSEVAFWVSVLTSGVLSKYQSKPKAQHIGIASLEPQAHHYGVFPGLN
ncbi:hypothetical protein DFH09DRAFT_1085002 [Mycena vulgaris]|nr:hypothetical protein DFH09DRAFT_1085002 [Mycena vulgaris]